MKDPYACAVLGILAKVGIEIKKKPRQAPDPALAETGLDFHDFFS